MMKGRYSVECVGADRHVKWREDITNVVMTIGKNAFLDASLAGNNYTVNGPFIGLISTVSYTGGPSVTDTMASHVGWLEAGSAQLPQYTGSRKIAAWSPATNGVKALASSASFVMLTSGAIKGCFMVFGIGAAATIDSTGGSLLSGGLFASGDKNVLAGDTLLVSYQVETQAQQPGGNPDADFLARRSAPGVVRYWDFDTAGFNPANVSDPLYEHGRGGNLPSHPFGWQPGEGGVYTEPTVDTAVKASGVAALRFTLRQFQTSGGNQPGYWYGNFADDYTRKFGDGETFYIQFRVRFDDAMLNTFFYAKHLTSLSPSQWLDMVDGSGNPIPQTWIAADKFSIPTSSQWQSWTGRAVRFHDGTSARGHYIGYGVVIAETVVGSTIQIQFVLTQVGTTWNTIRPIVAADYAYIQSNAVGVARGQIQGGIKLCDIVRGDDSSSVLYGTNVQNKIVFVCYGQHRFYVGYSFFQGSEPGMYETPPGSGEFILQTEVPACTYTHFENPTDRTSVTAGPCFGWVANEWMTFKVKVYCGTYDNNPASPTYSYCVGSEVHMWMAREGQPSVKLVEWTPSTAGYHPIKGSQTGDGFNYKWGKLNIFPWMTSKDEDQPHPDANMWIDEVILSTQDIADPSNTTGSGNMNPALQPPAGPNQARDLGSASFEAPIGDASQASIAIFAQSKFCFDARRNRAVLFGGGHAATNNDGMFELPFTEGVGLTYRSIYRPTPRIGTDSVGMWVESNYDYTKGAWLSGGVSGNGPYPRPVARHTLDETLVITDDAIGLDHFVVLGRVEGNTADSQASGGGLLGLWTKNGTQPAHAPVDHELDTAGQAAHYPLASGGVGPWSWAAIPGMQENGGNRPYAACEYDPVSKLVVICGLYYFETYDPVTKTRAAGNRRDMLANPIVDSVTGATVAPDGNNIDMNMVYCTANDKFYYFKHNGSAMEVWEITPNRANWPASQIVRLNPTGTPFPGTECGVAYDSDHALIGVGPWNSFFYVFDYSVGSGPTRGQWRRQLIPQASGSIGWNAHCLLYTPRDKVYVFITGGGGSARTWSYRWDV